MNVDTGCPQRPARWPRAGLLAACAAVTVMLAAACGGGSHAAGSGGSPAQDLSQQLTAYASCVRSHGVPDFYISRAGSAPPIPGSIREGASGLVIPPDTSPSAQKACQHLLPKHNPPTTGELHQQFIQALKIARCMRAHGYPTWPDPTVENGMVPNFIPSGIDTNSPQFNRAAKTCGAGP